MGLLKVGRRVFIRTVTHYHVGEVASLTKSWVVLKDSSWVADTGRFSDALDSGNLAEVEKIPGDGTCAVSRAAIVDVFSWNHPLPTSTK